MDNIEMVDNDILLLLSELNSDETGYLTGDFCNLLLPGIELLVGFEDYVSETGISGLDGWWIHLQGGRHTLVGIELAHQVHHHRI